MARAIPDLHVRLFLGCRGYSILFDRYKVRLPEILYKLGLTSSSHALETEILCIFKYKIWQFLTVSAVDFSEYRHL